MRRHSIPFHIPVSPTPERPVLSLLHAAIHAAESILRDEHADLDRAPRFDQSHAPVVRAAAHLIVNRCAELRSLLDFYDAAVDDVVETYDDTPGDVPF